MDRIAQQLHSENTNLKKRILNLELAKENKELRAEIARLVDHLAERLLGHVARLLLEFADLIVADISEVLDLGTHPRLGPVAQRPWQSQDGLSAVRANNSKEEGQC